MFIFVLQGFEHFVFQSVDSIFIWFLFWTMNQRISNFIIYLAFRARGSEQGPSLPQTCVDQGFEFQEAQPANLAHYASWNHRDILSSCGRVWEWRSVWAQGRWLDTRGHRTMWNTAPEADQSDCPWKGHRGRTDLVQWNVVPATELWSKVDHVASLHSESSEIISDACMRLQMWCSWGSGTEFVWRVQPGWNSFCFSVCFKVA